MFILFYIASWVARISQARPALQPIPIDTRSSSGRQERGSARINTRNL
jgi:hypothetical protein